MKFFTYKKQIGDKSEKGFTLLFSILVATLVVAIGATVISIAVRQTILSGTTRESQYAFYAANTVMECAMYWDVVGLLYDPNETDTAGTLFRTPISPTEFGTYIMSQAYIQEYVSCAGSSFVIDRTDTSGVDKFQITIEDRSMPKQFDHEFCAMAEVFKSIDSQGTIITTIEAKGYNTPCGMTGSPRAVERGLIQRYAS